MFTNKSLYLNLLSFFTVLFLFAQNKLESHSKSTHTNSLIFDNINYSSFIKSVQYRFDNSENTKHSFPALNLSKNEKLTITFDDLRAGNRSIYYSLIYCNADWTPNNLAQIDYLSGFNEDRIFTIKQSNNTLQSYTHYAFKFPNENMQPILSGNYLLKVYENDGGKEVLLFTRKIFFIKNDVNIVAQLTPSLLSESRTKNQKLNITVNSGQTLFNPNQTIQLHVFQNQRPDNFQIIRNPDEITQNSISYNRVDKLNFKGNAEFRTIDLRSIKSSSGRIESLVRDTAIIAKLTNDYVSNFSNYTFRLDNNGQFFIRNIDQYDADIESEYIYTHFSLKNNENIKGDIYLVGGFNNFSRTNGNKLTYDKSSDSWTTTQLFKQGVYDYEYIELKDGQVISDRISGSHYETENEYQVIVYYRKPGTRYDEIIGYKNISTNKLNNLKSGQ